uniref:Uncharacterized protein n=1 Tax=Anguilla anguilla TaxID=7936 RepID=A0A0E9UIX9_ANGAN
MFNVFNSVYVYLAPFLYIMCHGKCNV